MRISKVRIPSDEEFKEIVNNSFTYSECLRKLGLEPHGGSSLDTLKERIKELHCDISHFDRTKVINSKTYRQPLEDILIINSTYKSTSCLKKRLIKERILEEKCSCCGIGPEWNGLPLVLQLDHINGDHTDNRIENLRLLCPNCHSQTDTYAGKNMVRTKTIESICPICGQPKHPQANYCKVCADKKQRIISDRPTRENLLVEIAQLGFVGVGKKYGVSDNAIRKWCKAYNLPTTKQEIIKLYNENKQA